MCEDETPWVFLCSSAMLDHLACLVAGKNRGRIGYTNFIRQFMAPHRPAYQDFIYYNGNNDLPDQMYYILRCGLVHNFSFIPDQDSIRRGGRSRSIVLCHQKEAQLEGWHHLIPCSTEKINDGVLLIAEDFIEDISKAIDLVFKNAACDSGLRSRMGSWIKKHPPLAGGF